VTPTAAIEEYMLSKKDFKVRCINKTTMQPNTVFFSYKKKTKDYTLTVVDELSQETKSDSYIIGAGAMSVSIECLQSGSEPIRLITYGAINE
jgi:hypothetical protein